jgi:predicted Zn finger-like uncharacterized protein
MEVRCGNCKKLFRVSDDKIIGKGIKFACTRCGQYVKITMDDFSAYTLSRTAVSALDLSGQKPKSTTTETESQAMQVAGAISAPESTYPVTSAVEPLKELSKEPEQPAAPASGFPQGKEVLAASDLSHLEEVPSPIERHPAEEPGFPFQPDVHHETTDFARAEPEQKHEPQLVMETEAAKPVAAPDLESGLEMVSETEAKVPSQPETSIASASEDAETVHPEPEKNPIAQPELGGEPAGEPAATPEPEPLIKLSTETTEAARLESEKRPVTQPEPFAEATGALEPETVIASASAVTEAEQLEQKRGPQPAIRPEIEQAGKPDVREEFPQQKTFKPQAEPQPVSRPKPAVVSTEPGARKKEPARRPPSSAPAITAAPAETPRSGSKMMFIVAAVVIVALGGIGAFMLLQFQGTSTKGSAAHMTSTEGLRIVNASGSLEQNGDLVITGSVENSTDKPQSSWLVVVNVYDAKGTVINKLRLLNGKQIYTRNDYDILEKRGMRIQEMKEKALHEQGTVIPPKDKVAFEVRYLQPPADVASFNAILQPFDPARFPKDAAEQAD